MSDAPKMENISAQGSTAAEALRLDPLALPAETTSRFWLAALTALLLVWSSAEVLVPTRNIFAVIYEVSPELQEVLDRAIEEALKGRLELDSQAVLAHRTEMLGKLRELEQHYRRLFWVPAVLAIFLAMAWIGYRRLPVRLGRRYGIHVLEPNEAPWLRAEVESLCERHGVASPSELALRPGLLNGLAIHGKSGPCLVVDGDPARLERSWGDLHRAVLAHEVGHLANGDLWHREAARSAWRALVWLLPVVFGMAIWSRDRVFEPWFWRAAGTAGVMALFWAGLVRTRELYADAWAVRAGWGPALARRLRLPSPEPRGLRKGLWMHPSNRERLEYLREPQKLFRVSLRLAVLTGVLAGLVAGHAGGILHDGSLIAIQVFTFLGFAFGSLVVMILGIVTALVGSLVALVLLSYGISTALGLQTLRAAVADRMLRSDAHWGYGKLVAPAFCFVLGVELGGLLSFPIPSVSTLAPTVGFLALFTSAVWMWLVQVRAGGRWILAAADSAESALKRTRFLRWLAALQLALVLWPALLGRFSLALASRPEWVETLSRPGHIQGEVFFLSLTSAFVFWSWSLAASSILGLVIFSLILLDVFRSKRVCGACGRSRGSRSMVGRRCAGCGCGRAAWLTVPWLTVP